MKFLLSLLMFSSLFIGCSVVPLGIAPASQQLRTENGQNKTYEILGPVEDSDGYFSLFGFIPLGDISINRTFEKIAKENGGDALINVRYWYRDSFYFIGTEHSLEVKAEVIKFKENKKED